MSNPGARSGVLLWVVLAASSLLAALGPGQQAAAAHCQRVALQPVPSKVFSLAWSPDGRELALVDVGVVRVLRYSPEGRLLGEVARPGSGPGDFERPSRIHAAGQGFVVRDRAYSWIWLDRSYRPVRSIGPSDTLRLALTDEVLTPGELVGFGTFRKADSSWSFGLLRARAGPLELLEVIEEISLTSREGTLHVTLAPLVAQAAGGVYAVRFGEPPYLQRVLTKQRLKAFPAGFEKLPGLPENKGPDSDFPRHQVLLRSALPVGLYGSGGYLYLLTRQPAAGGVQWRLHKIDPVKDRLIASRVLPTSADDLALAPGPQSWAILEKGPMRPTCDQVVTGLLRIPASWIERAEAHSGAELDCR